MSSLVRIPRRCYADGPKRIVTTFQGLPVLSRQQAQPAPQPPSGTPTPLRTPRPRPSVNSAKNKQSAVVPPTRRRQAQSSPIADTFRRGQRPARRSQPRKRNLNAVVSPREDASNEVDEAAESDSLDDPEIAAIDQQLEKIGRPGIMNVFKVNKWPDYCLVGPDTTSTSFTQRRPVSMEKNRIHTLLATLEVATGSTPKEVRKWARAHLAGDYTDCAAYAPSDYVGNLEGMHPLRHASLHTPANPDVAARLLHTIDAMVERDGA